MPATPLPPSTQIRPAWGSSWDSLSEKTLEVLGSSAAGCSREANLLLGSIRQANRIIFDAAKSRPEYTGMGTTVVAILAVNERLVLAHVGDSRIYRVRNDQIVQLSRDHSLVQQQLESGIISAREAHGSQYRHLITRALGIKESVEIELDEQPALPGDILLLCSDGLSDLVEDDEMLAILREHCDALEKGCQALVDRANYKGGDDNITALLIQVREGNPGTPSRDGRAPDRVEQNEVRRGG